METRDQACVVWIETDRRIMQWIVNRMESRVEWTFIYCWLGLQRYTGAPVNRDIFCHDTNIDIWMGYRCIACIIKNEKLLYQHSEITVLISFMTPYPSTSLFLATGLRRCLVSFRMLPVTYISRWRHESMRSFNKLSADTVLCARNKNMRFVRGVTIQHSVDVVRLLIFPYMKYKSHLTLFFQVKKSVHSRNWTRAVGLPRGNAIH